MSLLFKRYIKVLLSICDRWIPEPPEALGGNWQSKEYTNLNKPISDIFSLKSI